MYLDHYSRAAKLSLLSDLKKLKVKVNSIWFLFSKERVVGICGTFKGVEIMILKDIYEKWDNFSGSTLYPIPHPDKRKSASSAYNGLSLWRGKYGKLRRELLDFCIQELERDLK